MTRLTGLVAALALAVPAAAFANAHKEAPMIAAASAPPTAQQAKKQQQDRAKKCKAEAAGKQAGERQAFIKTCVSA